MSKSADFALHVEDYAARLFNLIGVYFSAIEHTKDSPGKCIEEFEETLARFWGEAPRIPSIPLARLEEVLHEETSVVAEDDVPLLMDVIRREA